MKKINFITLFLLSFFLSNQSFAAKYLPDYSKSYIKFNGIHAEKNFDGKFEKWQAEINFDENNLNASSIKVVIDTASAKTGDKMYDGTLPTQDWFAIKEFPNAEFISTKLSKNNDNSYKAEGKLRIKNITLPISFDFQLDKIDSVTTKTAFNLIIDRLAFAIGKKSDGDAKWVKKEIKVDVFLLTKKQ